MSEDMIPARVLAIAEVLAARQRGATFVIVYGGPVSRLPKAWQGRITRVTRTTGRCVTYGNRVGDPDTVGPRRWGERVAVQGVPDFVRHGDKWYLTIKSAAIGGPRTVYMVDGVPATREDLPVALRSSNGDVFDIPVDSIVAVARRYVGPRL